MHASPNAQQVPAPRGEREVGWYRDPQDPRHHRYWDGERWSLVLPDDESEEAESRSPTSRAGR